MSTEGSLAFVIMYKRYKVNVHLHLDVDNRETSIVGWYYVVQRSLRG